MGWVYLIIIVFVIGLVVQYWHTILVLGVTLGAIGLAIYLIFKVIEKEKRRQASEAARNEERKEESAEIQGNEIEMKIARLKKQAEGRQIYEKGLEILSFFNNKVVRTYFFYWDEDSMNREAEKMKKDGIITYKKNSLSIEKEEEDLSITYEGKTVFGWRGLRHSESGVILGSGVYSYVPGLWEKEIEQLSTKVREEKERLRELAEKHRKKQEREHWGL